jgi:hypothetical protein
MISTTVDEFGTRRAVSRLVEGARVVSCTCCTAADITCCLLDTQIDLALYPNGVITQDKLPPTIVLDGVQYSLGTLGYGDTTNGVFLESGVWAVYKSGNRSTRRCLFSNIATDIEDEFPATLTATYSYFGLTVTASLTRTSVCLYEGVFTYEGFDYDVLVGHNVFSEAAASTSNVWTLRGPIIGVVDFGSGPEPILLGNNLSTNIVDRPDDTYTGEFAEDGILVTITATVTTP